MYECLIEEKKRKYVLVRDDSLTSSLLLPHFTPPSLIISASTIYYSAIPAFYIKHFVDFSKKLKNNKLEVKIVDVYAVLYVRRVRNVHTVKLENSFANF